MLCRNCTRTEVIFKYSSSWLGFALKHSVFLQARERYQQGNGGVTERTRLLSEVRGSALRLSAEPHPAEPASAPPSVHSGTSEVL